MMLCESALCKHGAVCFPSIAPYVSIASMAHGSNKTLGDLPGSYRMHFNCTNSPACHFNKPMEVEELITSLGPGFLTSDLYNVLKCPACKGRKFLVMLTPVHFSYGDAPRENVTPQSHNSQAKRGILAVNTQ